jgi:hypothetical protein
MSDQMMQSAIDYAYSYYQSRSGMGATCDFNGVATLTGTDPSSGTCKFASGPRYTPTSHRIHPPLMCTPS